MNSDLVRHVVVAICLTAGGIAAMVMHYEQIAGVCFGALAGYVIKNGVKKT